MAYTNEHNERTVRQRDYSLFKRISWGAVFAGFLLAVVINLTLNLLGVGIGIGAVDPTDTNAVPNALGIGAIIWYVLSTIASLVAGGWVAAHLAGIPKRSDAILHGLLTWCLFSIFSFYLLTTAVGKIVGATTSVVGKTLSLVGQGASAVAPQVGNLVENQLQQADIDISNIQQEAKEILRQTGKEELQPENIEQQAEQAGQTAKNTADSPEQLDEVVTRIFSKGEDVVSEVDKEAIVNVLVARTDQSRAEAQQTVNRWSQQYEQAKQKFAEVKQQAETKAKQTAESVASAISKAAIAGFFGLVIGAIASAAGGVMGKPKEREVEYA